MTQYLEEISYHIFIVSLRPLFEKGDTRWNEFVEVVRYHFTFMFCFAFFCKSLEMRIFRLAVTKLNTFECCKQFVFHFLAMTFFLKKRSWSELAKGEGFYVDGRTDYSKERKKKYFWIWKTFSEYPKLKVFAKFFVCEYSNMQKWVIWSK